VLSSPYLRCAQTACEIARELRLPVHFDLDLGEVFDFDEPGPLGPQHRPPEVLAEELESMYPDVELRRGADGKLVIRGAQQKHPETLLHARLRFAFKVQEAVRAASSSMMNIIVVTHADAVASIASFMNLELVVTAVPMAAFVTGQRGVGLSSGTWKNLIDTAKEPVFGRFQQWNVELSTGIVAKKEPHIAQKKQEDLRQMRRLRFKELLDPVSSIFTNSLKSNDTNDGSRSCTSEEVVRSMGIGETDQEAARALMRSLGLTDEQWFFLMQGLPLVSEGVVNRKLAIDSCHSLDDVLDPVISGSLGD